MGKRVPQKLKDQFAAELKAWRERRNLTQTEAAEALGTVSYTHLTLPTSDLV